MPNLKRKVALYGGSFDPPTVAHRAILETLVRFFGEDQFEELWVLPTFLHRQKESRSKDIHKHFNAKIDMCQKAFGGIPRVKVKALEKKYAETSGSTVKLVEALLRDESDLDIKLVVGQDVADGVLKSWYRGEDAIKMTPFIVVPRNGGKLPTNAWYKEYPHMYAHYPFKDMDLSLVSSTRARGYLKNLKELALLKDLLPRKVLEYVIENDMYQE